MRKTKMEAGGYTKSSIESLPSCLLINDIFLKLDLENLCTLSCVSTIFRSSASQALAVIPSLNLSGFSPDFATLKNILPKCQSIKTLTINCLRVDDDKCISSLLCPSIEELNLLCLYFLEAEALNDIGRNCPNLRSLMLELYDWEEGFTDSLKQMLIKCGKLESFHLKIRGEDCPHFDYINFMPSTIRSLKLEPLNEDDAVKLVCGTNPSASTTFIKANFLQTLQNLSLVLDVISDMLVLSIVKCIPNLLELHLEDRPEEDPTPSQDLTNFGLQSLACCRLKSLFLARSSRNHPTSFKRVNDMGILLLSAGCMDLESVGLSGFSEVTDAGYASILWSCPKLKKFEVRNAALLSDLTFYGLSHTASALEEVKLVSCYNITSETLMMLATKSSLELINLRSCWSVSDPGINSITSLNKLISLNLAGANITDTALSALSQCSSPIKSLSLRGCRGVTDDGIVTLFYGGGTVAKTLSTLDLSEIHGITDVAIEAVAVAGNAVTELSIKVCVNVTDSSIRALARKGQLGDGKNLPLRKLDVSACIGLTAASLGLFKKPTFRGLWWLGVGGTLLDQRGTRAFMDVLKERPWLTVCSDGCEMGCYDGLTYYDHRMHILGHPDPV